MKYQRPQLDLLRTRVNEKRKFIQVLMGPRQVGKTTLITQLLKGIKVPHLFVSADGIVNSDNSWIEQQWNTARLKLKQSEAGEFLLIIDEIQKIPILLDEVHCMIETYKNVQFIAPYNEPKH